MIYGMDVSFLLESKDNSASLFSSKSKSDESSHCSSPNNTIMKELAYINDSIKEKAQHSSTTTNLSYVDEAVREILENDCSKLSIDFDVIKLSIKHLCNDISSLKDEIVFLRTDSLFKNSIIGNLFSQLSDTKRWTEDSVKLEEIMEELALTNSPGKSNNTADMVSISDNDETNTDNIDAEFNEVDAEIEEVWENFQNAVDGYIKDATSKNELENNSQEEESFESSEENSSRQNMETQPLNSADMNLWDSFHKDAEDKGENGDSIKNPLDDDSVSINESQLNTTFTIGKAVKVDYDINSQLKDVRGEKHANYLNVRTMPRSASETISSIDIEDEVIDSEISDDRDTLLVQQIEEDFNPPITLNMLSCPVSRFDNPKAGITLRQLSDDLKFLNIDVIDNDNVDPSCVGKAGLHLNHKGSGKLAANFISQMKCL